MLSSYMHYCQNQKNRREKAVFSSKSLPMVMNENTNSYTQWLHVMTRKARLGVWTATGIGGLLKVIFFIHRFGGE